MRADAHENRQAILTAAWRLFSTIGIDVSMRTIASEAGMGIGTLYRHFPTKQDLLTGLFDYGRERLIDIIDPTPKAVDSLMRIDLPADVNIEIKL